MEMLRMKKTYTVISVFLHLITICPLALKVVYDEHNVSLPADLTALVSISSMSEQHKNSSILFTDTYA